MSRPKYEHVIWDWNGTLLDDAWLCVDIMNGLLSARGLSLLTPQRYAQVLTFPLADYYRELGFDFDREPFETLGAEFIREYERRRLECGLRGGALKVLGEVRAAGLSILTRRDIVFREGSPPLVSLFACALESDLPVALRGQTFVEPPLLIRLLNGDVGPEYRTVKYTMGFRP